MKEVIVEPTHPFFEDFDRKMVETNTDIHTPYNELLKLVKEWYGYDVVVEELGTSATIHMSDQDYTIWLLKWG